MYPFSDSDYTSLLQLDIDMEVDEVSPDEEDRRNADILRTRQGEIKISHLILTVSTQFHYR